jgi:hypothetical protein
MKTFRKEERIFMDGLLETYSLVSILIILIIAIPSIVSVISWCNKLWG